VRDRAREVGLGPLRTGHTAHYLGVGNAPDAFRSTALDLCEELAEDYFQHFAKKQFAVVRPEGRLVVVLLADPEDFARFLDLEAGGAVRGIYDLDTNRLVVCDNRDDRNPRAERANSVALFHEATHQLTFNSGLLNREGDVPLGISEGLAMYGEVRRPKGKTRIGARNAERLVELAKLSNAGGKLFPLGDLLGKDDLINDASTAQGALAQSWLLVHYLLQAKPALTTAFRAYLDAIRSRTTAEHRLEDAGEHLGDLGALDRELARYANRMLR
jgi:hypothetical protein